MSSRFSRISLLACFLAHVAYVHAAEEDKSYSVSGFGTLGVVHSNTRDVDIVRDLTQPYGVGYSRQTDFGVDSNLGLQINYRPSENFDTALQVVARRSAEVHQPQLTWAYARYLPNDTVQLRAGRLGFDVYLLADSRNVAYSYQWVRPPVDFFGNVVITYFDGADVVVSRPLGEGIVRAKFFAGVARERTTTDSQYNYLSLNGSPLTGAHIEYQSQNWIYRVGYSELKFKHEFPPLQGLLDGFRSPALNAVFPYAAGLGNALSMENKRFKYLSAGAAYDNGPLQVQLMVNRLSSESLLFPASRSAYLTMGYRIDNWTPYATYSINKTEDQKIPASLPTGISPGIDMLVAGFNQSISSQFNHQTTLSIGVRYDLTEKSNLKLQVDQIHADQFLLVRNAQPGWNGKARLFSLAFNFIF
ncbi:porin [Undibacterium sp. Di26W]|uniref:porin n=1 Tax=Undibacterium sp. Di26W TaxID=3413035 RepID=UPI003BF38B96